MPERTLNSGRGQTLITTLSDDQAIACCRKLKSAKFAQKLVAQYDNYKRRLAKGWAARPLSEAQLYWVHKYALEGEFPKDHPHLLTGDLAGLVRLFQRGASHVTYPKIHLELPADPNQPNGPRQPLGLAFSSQAAAQFARTERPRYPGSINVTDGAPFGKAAWYGRVMPNGDFYRARQCPDSVVYLLKRFAQDPVGVARESGRLTGKCPFCGNALTDDRSQLVGYGPVCAQHYVLPWGEAGGPNSDLMTVLGPHGVEVGTLVAQEPSKPLFDDPKIQAEYARLLNLGVPPAIAEERVFDALQREADRKDQERADRHSIAQEGEQEGPQEGPES